MDFTGLGDTQAGVVTRRQLNECGMNADGVRHRVARGRWQLVGPTVVVLTSGPLSDTQRAWAAVLSVTPTAVIAGVGACTDHGLRGWHRDAVTVMASKNATVNVDLPWSTVLRTRRDLGSLMSTRSGPPRLRLEPAALLHAATCRSEREAHGLLAACVQQRVTTPDRLAQALMDLAPLRRAASLRRCLRDVAEGAGSRAEIDIGTMCRDHGLVRPARQVRRRDSQGRVRFTDCEWALPGGRTLVLEVDGSFHMDAAHWEADIQRSRRVLHPSIQLLRATSRERACQLHRRLGEGDPSIAVDPTTRSVSLDEDVRDGDAGVMGQGEVHA